VVETRLWVRSTLSVWKKLSVGALLDQFPEQLIEGIKHAAPWGRSAGFSRVLSCIDRFALQPANRRRLVKRRPSARSWCGQPIGSRPTRTKSMTASRPLVRQPEMATSSIAGP